MSLNTKFYGFFFLFHLLDSIEILLDIHQFTVAPEIFYQHNNLVQFIYFLVPNRRPLPLALLISRFSHQPSTFIHLYILLHFKIWFYDIIKSKFYLLLCCRLKVIQLDSFLPFPFVLQLLSRQDERIITF